MGTLPGHPIGRWDFDAKSSSKLPTPDEIAELFDEHDAGGELSTDAWLVVRRCECPCAEQCIVMPEAGRQVRSRIGRRPLPRVSARCAGFWKDVRVIGGAQVQRLLHVGSASGNTLGERDARGAVWGAVSPAGTRHSQCSGPTPTLGFPLRSCKMRKMVVP